MSHQASPAPAFPGFPDFRANVTFVPLQFFTVVLPHCSRGTVRVVGYALRKVLGWVDTHGNPTREQLRFTYRELIAHAGVSRTCIAEALREALQRRCLRCVQAPQPDATGKPGQSGIYELCWDDTGSYTDDPARFRGFYYPEAVIVEEREGAATVRRPKAARKNIPNAFFDHLLPRERLSVIRVVGALLFYSIQWGPGGERRMPVSRSITALSRLTNHARRHVHEAVLEARKLGYIEQVDAGCFDPAAAQTSRAATYGIRWAPAVPVGRLLSLAAVTEAPVPAPNRVEKTDRYEKGHGGPVLKGIRDRYGKGYGDQSEKVNGISIKRDLKTNTAAKTAAVSTVAAVATELELLKQTGFDETTAKALAARQSAAVIRRQIQWLPLRHTTRNRLGLLRRAIEEDWPRPEGAETDDSLKAGKEFASHYYAAYHGFSGEAGTEPFPKDIHAAAAFVSRLLTLRDEPAAVAEWGRQFGALVRQRNVGNPKARPHLSAALVLHGDAFLRQLEGKSSAFATHARQKAQAARQATLWPRYMAYLRLAEIEAQQSARELYTAFSLQRQRTREAMTGGLFHASPETLARFDGEESRWLALAEYCASRKANAVLTFDAWSSPLSASTSASQSELASVLPFPKPGAGIMPPAAAADSPPPGAEGST